MMNVPTKDETFVQKAIRKSKNEPLVPLGALVTVVFLTAGLRSFHQGHKAQGQMMMRGRVVAQGVTILAMAWGAFYGLKPHDRPKEYEEQLSRIHADNDARGKSNE